MHDAASHVSPYPGLRPFTSSEADIFFGRETHTDRLLEILKREHFLAIVGPSGSGKSSLMRAGLLPALEMGNLGSGTDWRIAVLRPGGDPLRSLASALLRPGVFGASLGSTTPSTPGKTTDLTAMVEAELRRGPLGLLHASAEALAAPSADGRRANLLVVVDQFEEIFTYAEADDEHADDSDLFVNLLLEARAVGDAQIYVVLTMRTDFLGNCVRFPLLPDAINRAQYLTPRLTRAEMELAIEGPAQVFGGTVDGALVTELINATRTNSDQLPVLQHALSRMWAIAAERNPLAPQVGWDEAHEVGGLSGALDQHAETVLRNVLGVIGEERAGLVESLFAAITERRGAADGGQDVRRPQRLARIAQASGLGADWRPLVPIVSAFSAPGVSLLQHGAELNEHSVIDLSHEALMRQWHRLAHWVDAEARRRNDYLRWRDRALEHENERAGLLEGVTLARAIEWLKGDPKLGDRRWRPTAAWASRYTPVAPETEFQRTTSFIELSTEAQQAREEQKRVAAEEQRRAAIQRATAAEESERRARRQLLAMTAFALLVVALAVTATYFAVKARRSADQAAQAEARAQLAQAQAEESARRLDEQLARRESTPPAATVTAAAPAAAATTPSSGSPAPAPPPPVVASRPSPQPEATTAAAAPTLVPGAETEPAATAAGGAAPPEVVTTAPPGDAPATAATRPSGSRQGNPSSVPRLTVADLEKIMPASAAASRTAFLTPLNDAMVEFDINTPLRAAHFLGQVSFESGDLRYLQEQWGPTSAQRRYEPPAALASSLGNTEAGDGKKYLGRGIFQIVGRRNYTQLGQLLKLNLVDNPDLAARPDVAARTAGAFWMQRGLSKLADGDDVTGITRRISGGMLGLETRKRAVDRAKALLLSGK